jgi:hypothetical protein
MSNFVGAWSYYMHEWYIVIVLFSLVVKPPRFNCLVFMSIKFSCLAGGKQEHFGEGEKDQG